MGTVRCEIMDGVVEFFGDFDERDLAVARRAFPGFGVYRTGGGLAVGPVAPADVSTEEWVDEIGTRWHRVGSHRSYQLPGTTYWAVDTATPDERQASREQAAADRTERWAEIVSGYETYPDEIFVSWRYLIHHPIFYRWEIPPEHLGLAAEEVTEATWARIESSAHLVDWCGLDYADTHVWRDDDCIQVAIEHGPILWPLDTSSGHRHGMSISGTPSHDIDLDAIATSWEDAVIALAANVCRKYGHDRSHIPE